jgi:hypothetical protein
MGVAEKSSSRHVSARRLPFAVRYRNAIMKLFIRGWRIIGPGAAMALCLWPSSCLDFTQCRWCADSGTNSSCATANLWPTGFRLPLPPGTACSYLDAGLDDAGGLGSATCALADGASSGTHWGLASQVLSEAAGVRLCARVVMEQTPLGGLDVGMTCSPCSGTMCSCQKPECDAPAGVTSGAALVGPFQVPAVCGSGVVVVFQSVTDGGSLQFSQGWLWQTADGGCIWNDARQCAEE